MNSSNSAKNNYSKEKPDLNQIDVSQNYNFEKNQNIQSPSPKRDITIDQRVIRELNSSILQAAEIQNRIKKVQQLETSPLIDSYNSINEPHAHPMGLMYGVAQNAIEMGGLKFQNTPSDFADSNPNVILKDQISFPESINHQNYQFQKKSVISNALKMNRVFPININYKNSFAKIQLNKSIQSIRDSAQSNQSNKFNSGQYLQLPSIINQAESGVRLNSKLNSQFNQKKSKLNKNLNDSSGINIQGSQSLNYQLTPNVNQYPQFSLRNNGQDDVQNKNMMSTHQTIKDSLNTGRFSNQSTLNSNNQQSKNLGIPLLNQGGIATYSTLFASKNDHRSKIILSKNPNIFTQNQSSNFAIFENNNSNENSNYASKHLMLDAYKNNYQSNAQQFILAPDQNQNFVKKHIFKHQINSASGALENIQKSDQYSTSDMLNQQQILKTEEKEQFQNLNSSKHNRVQSINIPTLNSDRILQSFDSSVKNSNIDHRKNTTSDSFIFNQNGSKIQSNKPLNVLNKYVENLENQNVSKLSDFMINRKYFHKFDEIQELKRISLLRDDGKIDDQAFDFIHNQQQFKHAIKSSLKIQPQNPYINQTDAQFNIQKIQQERKKNFSTQYFQQNINQNSQVQNLNYSFQEGKEFQESKYDEDDINFCNPDDVYLTNQQIFKNNKDYLKNKDINYRDLMYGLNKVSPGGRGGPGPNKMCEKPIQNLQEQKYILSSDQFNQTPFVNQSPTQRKQQFLTSRGIPIQKTLNSPINAVSQIMGQGTASGVKTQRFNIRRKSQMEKMQLQMIVDKLQQFDQQIGESNQEKKKKQKKNSSQQKKKEIEKQRKLLEQQQIEQQIQPLMYEDKIINDGQDLLKLLKSLDLNSQMTRENIKKATFEYKDDLFDRLLENLLPKSTNYNKMNQGDIMFNIDQANHLTYDIVQEKELKKLREEELEREKERQLMKARKAGGSNVVTSMTAGKNSAVK